MKTFLKLYLVLLFTLDCHFYQIAAQEKPLQNLANTKWTVTLLEVVDKTDSTKKISETKFEEGKNVITFDALGEYKTETFLGLEGLQGAYIQEGNTLVLSDPQKRAYYWVFEVKKMLKNELKITFVSFKPESKKEILTLKPYTGNATNTAGTSDSLSLANKIFYEKIDGTWEWVGLDSKKLTISLFQSGSGIIGWHTYGKEGESYYEIRGTVKGNVAHIELKKAAENDSIQPAKLKLSRDENGTTLIWELILEKGKPAQINTQDRVSLKRVGDYKDLKKL
jgi:hypothetical protein